MGVGEGSRACGGMGVGFAVNALGSLPLLVGGTEGQKEGGLPGIAAGEKLIAFGLSEKDAGSDAGGMTTRAQKDDDGYVLNREKKWNTDGSVASYNTSFAVTEQGRRPRGVSAFCVAKNTPGYSAGQHHATLRLRCLPALAIE